MRRNASWMLGLAVFGCTFNVQSVDVRGEDQTTASFSRLEADLRSSSFLDGDINILGTAGSGARVALSVTGLLGATASSDAVRDGIMTHWNEDALPILGLSVEYRGPSVESLWLSALDIDLPRATEIELYATYAQVSVEGVTAPMHVETVSGDIRVVGGSDVDLKSARGAVDVQAATASHVESGLGAITLEVAGTVEVLSDRGNIDGTIGDGGSIRSAFGQIGVELTGALSRNLALNAENGNITLVVSRSANLMLALLADRITFVAADGTRTESRGTSDRMLGTGGFNVLGFAPRGHIVVEAR